ncbi:ParB N-terminal domain-containing protein [Chania multitudinisentens]|uniref:ParB N-terminal domain-containing protein n=1 Tax=Chania multitudinisentens TaxID=1639108 RepID=UPI0009005D06|nr:ParB N-terminal domain-containing protein [Chania multitudinisentens]
MNYDVVLCPLTLIRPSEEVNKQHVEYLADTITLCQRWVAPVPIERQTGIIMDGNHRYQAAHRLELMCIPCIMLDYSDKRVRVYHWCSGKPFCPDKIRQHIIDCGKVFPYKTTRHQFSPPLPTVEFDLQQLSYIADFPS